MAHKGDYTTWLIGNLVVQALFTGVAWLYIKDTRFNSKYLPFVLAGISLIFPLIGALTRNNPEKKQQKQTNSLKNLIKNGNKYREFQSFVMSHKTGIGAVTKAGQVYYSDTEPVFVDKENQDDISKIWNPKLGYPRIYGSGKWQTRDLFTVSSDERSWTCPNCGELFDDSDKQE